MGLRVEITPRAERDLDRIYSRVTRDRSLAGVQWFDRLEAGILSLERMPERCVAEPGLSTARRVVRKLLFGTRHVYRIYFTVRGEVVTVLPVRHGAMKEPRRV